MAIIFGASSIPNLQRLPADISDKTGHSVGYALLGALLTRGFADARLKGVTGRTGWWALAASALYGASDEFHQRFVPGRTAAIDDWVADVAGAGVAALLIVVLARVLGARTREV